VTLLVPSPPTLKDFDQKIKLPFSVASDHRCRFITLLRGQGERNFQEESFNKNMLPGLQLFSFGRLEKSPRMKSFSTSLLGLFFRASPPQKEK